MKWPLRRPAPPEGSALYAAIVARARDPVWYRHGGVPDTVDGRFDMVVAILGLVLLRLEGEGADVFSVALTERFIADMDGSLRQLGFGDPALGKQVGHMVAALGGRLGVYRDALAGANGLRDALARNLYRGAAVDAAALDWCAARLQAIADELAATPVDTLVAEQWETRA